MQTNSSRQVQYFKTRTGEIKDVINSFGTSKIHSQCLSLIHCTNDSKCLHLSEMLTLWSSAISKLIPHVNRLVRIFRNWTSKCRDIIQALHLSAHIISILHKLPQCSTMVQSQYIQCMSKDLSPLVYRVFCRWEVPLMDQATSH